MYIISHPNIFTYLDNAEFHPFFQRKMKLSICLYKINNQIILTRYIFFKSVMVLVITTQVKWTRDMVLVGGRGRRGYTPPNTSMIKPTII